jgi:hypothetical protein
MALRARLRRRAALRAGPLAGRAHLVGAERDFPGRAERRVREAHGESAPYVGAAFGLESALLVEPLAEEVAEDVREMREDIFVRAEALEAHVAQTLCAATVVSLPLLLVGEDVVSLSGFLELLLRIRIVGVLVRVELERELPIGFADLVVGSRLS